jgi:hypothetical protein
MNLITCTARGRSRTSANAEEEVEEADPWKAAGLHRRAA